MSSSSWRSETEGRLRKAQVSLEAARALIDRKPPCTDDAVNRASAAALQAARALVDARWPPRDQLWDPTWRPGMLLRQAVGPYSKASWPVIVQQFEKATLEMALPFDSAEHLRALVEDGHSADVGDMTVYENEEAVEAVETAEKLVKSVTHSLPLAFALGYRELDDSDAAFEMDNDENATTLEVMPVPPALEASTPTDPHLEAVKLELDLKLEAAPAPTATQTTDAPPPSTPASDATPTATTTTEPAAAAPPAPTDVPKPPEPPATTS